MLNRLRNAMATLAGDVPDYPVGDRRPAGRIRGPGGGGIRGGDAKRTDADGRLPYSRPHFLHLSGDEVTASGDKTSRPIILPRDVTKVPWCAGYAEVINAGKSEVNEDQARAERIILKNCASNSSPEINKITDRKFSKDIEFPQKLNAESNLIVPDCLDKPGNKTETESASPAVNSDPSSEAEEPKEIEKSQTSVVDKEVDSGKVCIHNEKNLMDELESNEDEEDTKSKFKEEKNRVLVEDEQVTMTYFGIFDGHAGYGAAVMAAASLHYIITDNLLSIIDLLSTKKDKESSQSIVETTNSNRVDLYSCCICQCHRQQMMQKSKAPMTDMAGPMPMIDKTNDISVEELVIGAVEKSFQEMDKAIDDARKRFNDTIGGCTALASIFFMGKLFIANAGDCRAVICHDGKAVPVSFDFTPETERKRIYMLANLFPQLLHNEFTDREFVRRPTRKDIGKKLLCREAWMSGWSLRTVKVEDLKVPIITGEGKRARLLSTIGVSRGFGDHNLRLYDSDIWIKPFLSSVPDIKVIDMNNSTYNENDVLIMASDGLWDVINSDQAAIIVQNSLSTVETSNPKRYTLAAQDLLIQARGVHQGQWKTVDDITVFVIPLYCYGNNNSKV